MSSTDFKRGGTFSRAGLFKLPAGDWEATSQVNTPNGKLVCELTCELAALPSPDENGNTHALVISATADQTKIWPLQSLPTDIKFADPAGVVMYTSTYTINVLKNETP